MLFIAKSTQIIIWIDKAKQVKYTIRKSKRKKNIKQIILVEHTQTSERLRYMCRTKRNTLEHPISHIIHVEQKETHFEHPRVYEIHVEDTGAHLNIREVTEYM